MAEKDLPNIVQRVEAQREQSALTDQVASIENEREAHLRREYRAGMIEVKSREFLAAAADAVTDNVLIHAEQRYIAAVERNRDELDAERAEEDRAEIAEFLKDTQKLRGSTFKQVGKVTAEEVAAIALRPYEKYEPKEAPEPATPPPPAKKKIVVVTKGGLFRADKIEEFEV